MSANWELCKGAPDIIKTMMAKELNDGTLMLVLGAGASASVGLPSWIDLVNKCIETCNADKKVSPAIEYIDHSYPLTTILKRTSRVKEHYSDHEYALLIKKSLYYQLSEQAKGFDTKSLLESINHYIVNFSKSKEPLHETSTTFKIVKTLLGLYKENNITFVLEFARIIIDKSEKNQSGFQDLLKNDLLIAIGSLLMGTQRGSISDVVTYNFDDVLEWYLNLYGYVIDVVTDPLALTKNVDVRIFHPHGFLPFNKEFEKKFPEAGTVVFDETSFNQRIGNKSDSSWRKRLEILLSTKKAIFIGLSGEDPTFGPMCRLAP